jgi:predicted ferric reductase
MPAAVRSLAHTLGGPLLLVLLCLVPVWLWARALPLEVRVADLSSTLSSVSVVLGLAGTCAFALNLVLGARFAFVDGLFGGLDRMYRVHQANGRIAFGLLVGHAVLMVSSRLALSPQATLDLFSPTTGWTVPLGALALIAMAASIWLTLYAPLNHELFVYVQRSFGFVFVVGSLHVFRTPGTKASSAALTVYLTAIAAAGLGAFAYRSLLDNVLVKRHRYLITEAKSLNPSVMEITMTPLDGGLRFRPGQFVYVTFASRGMDDELHPVTITSEGPSEVVTIRAGAIHHQFHPFSVTSGPDDRDLRVTVKAVGDYTAAMRALERGALARVEGPYGKFSYTLVANRRQIWVAGGIGITPFLSMARSLRDPGPQVDLYYGVKSRREALFADDLRHIAARYGRLRLFVVAEDEAGFITAEGMAASSEGFGDADFFICGPPAMIENLRKQLQAAGIPPRRIHFELFGFVKKRNGAGRRAPWKPSVRARRQ